MNLIGSDSSQRIATQQSLCVPENQRKELILLRVCVLTSSTSARLTAGYDVSSDTSDLRGRVCIVSASLVVEHAAPAKSYVLPTGHEVGNSTLLKDIQIV